MTESTYDDWPASWGPPPAAVAAQAGWYRVSGRISGLGNATAALLALNAVAAVVSGVAAWQRIALVDRLRAVPAFDAGAQLRGSDEIYALVGGGSIVLKLVTGVAFIVWLDRAYGHAARRQAWRLRHSSGWVVGSWFVPFLNLVRPKQLVDDVWRASRVSREEPPSVPWYVHAWWGAWLAASSLGWQRWPDGGTLEERRQTAEIALTGDACLLVAAVLAFVVVRELTRRQETWLVP